MSTPFDDDALQEGLAHGLGVARHAPGSYVGLAKDLLTGSDTANHGSITLSHYPGSDGNKPGHIGISLNGGRVYGKVPIPGDDIQSLFMTVPGIVEPVDPARKPVDQLTLPADPGQIDYLQKYLQNRSQPTTYQAETDNCANYLYDALRGAGYRVPPLNAIETPAALMQGMRTIQGIPVPPSP